jgi:toxin ParE1/3/4
MNRFRLSRQARADIHAIWDYIGIVNDNPSGAEKQVETLFAKLRLLAAQPMMGELREDLRPELRTFTAGSYVILYYAKTHGIEVAGVVHGARDLETMFRRMDR